MSVETVELIHDTDYAQYFDCLHYTNEFTNTYSIKYCIQPENSIRRKLNNSFASINDESVCK
jgi:hypothetical protein